MKSRTMTTQLLAASPIKPRKSSRLSRKEMNRLYANFYHIEPVRLSKKGKQMLVDLRNYLDEKFGTCRNDFRTTEAFFASRGLNFEDYRQWFEGNHAHCDCEIGMNGIKLLLSPPEDYMRGKPSPGRTKLRESPAPNFDRNLLALLDCKNETDKRFADSVRTWRGNVWKEIASLVRCESKLATSIQWNGRFGAAITQNGFKVYFTKGRETQPAPGGLFMSEWEPDMLWYFGIGPKDWERMPFAEKALAEAKLQAILWARKCYESCWTEFYAQKESDELYWRFADSDRMFVPETQRETRDYKQALHSLYLVESERFARRERFPILRRPQRNPVLVRRSDGSEGRCGKPHMDERSG